MARRRVVYWVVSVAVLAGVVAEVGLARRTVSRGFARGSGAMRVDWSRDVKTYNCAGLVFGTYRRMSLEEVEHALAGFQTLARGDAVCPAGWVKIWVWAYDVHHETEDGWVEPSHRDGHLVAGRTSVVDGSGPRAVYCKYGAGAVLGPGEPESWVPPARELVGKNMFGVKVYVVREHVVERWYCAPMGALGRSGGM